VEKNKSEKWSSIYLTTSILTIIMLVIIPIQIIVFILTPHPLTTIGWLDLFNSTPLLGMIHMDILYLVNNIILAFIYLSLLFSLFESNRNIITLAFMLGMIGLIAYISSNKTIEMFFLSKEYVTASDELTRNILISSAKNMLLEWKGTAYVTYYFLGDITLFLISIAMFRSSVYSRATAICGFTSAIFMTIPANFGSIGLIFSLLSLIPWYIFCILLIKTFIKLGNYNKDTQTCT